jgi:hypothetical protein
MAFCLWLKQFFKNGGTALQNPRPDTGRQPDERRIATLKARVRSKDGIPDNLMEEEFTDNVKPLRRSRPGKSNRDGSSVCRFQPNA